MQKGVDEVLQKKNTWVFEKVYSSFPSLFTAFLKHLQRA